MAGWVNHVVIDMARNGTASHTVDPATAAGGTVVGGALFSPTSSRLLVCAAYGAVTSGSTTGVPANAPTNWQKGTEAVNNGGLYVWYRTASATTADRVIANHNGSNYPVVFEFWEFPAGTTWSGAVAAVNVSSGASGATLGSLTGTNMTFGLYGSSVFSGTGPTSVAWSTGTEQSDTFQARAGSPATDGFAYSATAIEDDVAASRSFTPTFSGNGAGSLAAERIVFAVKVATVSAPPEGAATLAASFELSATGKRRPKGSAVAAAVFELSAAGEAPAVAAAEGAAAISFSFDLTAAGETPAVPAAEGAAVVEHAWQLTAAGETPGVDEATGAAEIVHSWQLSAAGKRTPRGTAIVTAAWALAARGTVDRTGAAGIEHSWQLAAAGEAPILDQPTGQATLSHQWTVTAAGKSIRRGSAQLAWLIVLSAVGEVERSDTEVSATMGSSQRRSRIGADRVTAKMGRP